MKRTNISVFIPHIGCPHRCSFCDQRSISGAAHAPSPEEVAALLEEQAPHLAERGMQAEIAFFGGSFTAVPREYMVSLRVTFPAGTTFNINPSLLFEAYAAEYGEKVKRLRIVRTNIYSGNREFE